MSNSAEPDDRRSGAAATLLAALLPRQCFLCAAPAAGEFLCPACHEALPHLSDECCPVCAVPTPSATVCGACLKKPPHFDATQAVFRYQFPLDRLVQSLKYAHRLSSADFFGRILAQRRPRVTPDLLLPVPLAPRRLAERGFNQAVEIARPLAHQLGMPLETRHIQRRIDTAPQATLPWRERAGNIRHAFACGIDLTGKSILVIDDVMTTGATMNELAGTLKAGGAARVENLLIARALKD